MKTIIIYIIVLLTGTTLTTNAQQLAFPGAEGFGKYASGGRGGKVYTVTNLNDSGDGSFRAGLEAFPGEPLTIVFAVGGTIELQSPIRVRRSDLTIAGQTAPSPGITLKGHSFVVNGASGSSSIPNYGNIIIRYLRSRPGIHPNGDNTYGLNLENTQNVIIDHCSFSWATEECAAIYDTENITVQWSVFSEGLYNAGHGKGNRSYGGVWGGQYSSFHHNLIAHQNGRAIRFNGARAHDVNALVDYRNNVVYNAGTHNAAAGGDVEIVGGESKINLVNNYYKAGPATPSNYSFIQADIDVSKSKGRGQFYVDGNVMTNNSQKTANNWSGVDFSKITAANLDVDVAKSALPFPITHALPSESAETAYEKVLKGVGAILPQRDGIDKRIINETATGTAFAIGATSGKGGIIDNPDEVGGWETQIQTTGETDTDGDGIPDSWEIAHGMNPNDATDRNNINASGYTQLEEYINSITSVNTNQQYSLLGFGLKLNATATTTATINWVVSNEGGLQSISLERSQDGVLYTEVALNSSPNVGLGEYSYTDQSPLGFDSYYRLKFTDLSNNTTYGDPILLSNPIAEAYWTEPFSGTFQTSSSIENPDNPKINNTINGDWIFYISYKETKSFSDPEELWKNGNPSIRMRNHNVQSNYSYVITPVFNQGVSKITFNEINRSTVNANKIEVYTSTDGGATWSNTFIGNPAKTSQFDLITINIDNVNVNRLKIVNNNGSDLYIDNFTIYAPVGVTVPLDLLSFNAAKNNGQTVLEWKTTNEVNMASFEIERSTDGKSFYRIGEKSANNVQGVHIYSFVDQALQNGVNYYRLKQVDQNGKYQYSHAIAVENKIGLGFNVYPNPTEAVLNVRHKSSNKATIKVLDLNGRTLISQSVAKENTFTQLDVSDFVSGIYFIIYDDSGQQQSLKFIKK